MPCRDYEAGSYYDVLELNNKVHTLTRLLCTLCQASWGEIDFPPEVEKWWEDHRRKDRERIKAEAARRLAEDMKEQALKKLTPAERKLLGLKPT